MNRKRKLLLIGIIIAAVIIGVIIALLLSGQKKELPVETEAPTTTVQETTTIEEPTEETTVEETTEEETTTKEIVYVDPVVDFDDIHKINKDAYAYIYIPDTPISYPIMQSKKQDDDYYLNTTFEGYPGLPGSIYTQKITSKNFSDYNSVIYGHDMADESFFGSLYHYIDEDYFREHSTIYIYTPKYERRYHVVAQSTVDDWNISYLYNTKISSSNRKFWKDIHNGEAENRFDEDYTYQKGDRFITLSTCIGWRPNNRRVIVAVLTEKLAVRQTKKTPEETTEGETPGEETLEPEP